tara:strand:+ start:1116 stop:2018 length:903 start_codon:yes stop_codon:yes gene_type:complete
MTIDVDERPGDIRVVALGGDMDLYASNSVKETVVRLWEAGVRNLVVDLSHLDYVDSSGIGVLLYVYSASQKRGNRVIFAGPHGAVWKVIELTKLNGFLPVVETLEEAVEALRPVDDETTPRREPAIRQLQVNPDSPLFDTRSMYHKAFNLDISQVRRLANLIAQKAPPHLRDINILEQQISELLKNAVKHGNRNDPRKTVKVWFLFTSESARLIVEDEGDGFGELEAWNEFYRRKIQAYRSQDFEAMMNYLSFRTDRSTEHDGGNAMMAAVEYWNEGVVFNEARNTVAVMRSFGDERNVV